MLQLLSFFFPAFSKKIFFKKSHSLCDEKYNNWWSFCVSCCRLLYLAMNTDSRTTEVHVSFSAHLSSTQLSFVSQIPLIVEALCDYWVECYLEQTFSYYDIIEFLRRGLIELCCPFPREWPRAIFITSLLPWLDYYNLYCSCAFPIVMESKVDVNDMYLDIFFQDTTFL